MKDETKRKIRVAENFYLETRKYFPLLFRILRCIFFFFVLSPIFGNYAMAKTPSYVKSATGLKKFSIIIPIYNTEKYLSECIESVVNQSYKDIEIILVNDGSPGNADEICKKYAQRDNRIKYIKQKNQGVSIARNNGIKASSGDYIFCADSDDTLEKQFIEKVCRVFEKESCDCVVIGKNFCSIPIKLIGALPVWGIAVTKSFLEKYPDIRFPEHMQPCEDGLFTHEVITLSDNISFCESAVYLYRQHSTSSEHNIDKSKVLKYIPRLLMLLEEFYTKHNLWSKKKLQLLAFIKLEPFGRYRQMPFSVSERNYLFDLLHDFMKKHELNRAELASNFPYNFRSFMMSNFDCTYKLKRYTDVATIFFKSIFLALNECKNDLIKAITNSSEEISRIKEIRKSAATKTKGKKHALNKKKLLLIGDHLVSGQGGVEHVLCNMANVMNECGYDVTVTTMDNKQGSPFFSLNKDVKFVNLYKKISFLDKAKVLTSTDSQRFFVKLRYRNNIYNGLIKKLRPNLIICFSLPILLDVTYKKDFDIPVILTVHGNPINDYSNRFWPRPNWKNELLEKTYQNADIIQVLSDSYRSTVPKSFKGEVVTISNIAKKFGDFAVSHKKQGRKKIVCIASLDDRKHQDLLIRAFSSIAKDYPEWNVELWGSGCKREEYQKMISSLEMENRILLKGSTKNVDQILKNTDIFALPSTCEGWPLVFGEAMNMGIPCIGLSSCDGVNEIIRNNENGMLSEDSFTDFAQKLKFLMDNPGKREKMGIRAKKDMENHSEDIIWGKWKDLIQKYVDKVPIEERN